MTWRATLILPLALAACVGAPAVVPPPVPLPPEQRTLAQEIAATPMLASFAAQLSASGLPRLAQPAPVTVFAADEGAYARLAPGVAAALREVDNRPLLTRFVGFHFVEGALDQAELRRRVVVGSGRASLPTLAGEALTVTLTSNTLTLTDADGDRAYLIQAEVRRRNGVLHIVNGVLAPSVD